MITKRIWLSCPPARAFALFTQEAGAWWPEDRRHTGDAQSVIRMEASGRFWERARDGREVELGRVTTWEPPHRLMLDFFVGSDPDHPTRVEVTFLAEGDGTRVTVLHGPGPDSADLYGQRAPRFERSWEAVLAALASHAPR